MSTEIKMEITRVCGVPAERIEDSALLVEYGLDSARAMQLVLALEQRFHIQIPDEAVPRLRTVRDIAVFLEQSKLKANLGNQKDNTSRT